MLLYTNHITPRLQYIATTLLGNHVIVVDDQENFIHHYGNKINYSAQRLTQDELWIQPHGLLSETGIQPQQIDAFEWNGLKTFFKTSGHIPFDIFAASFYLLSRYEEYLPHQLDMYGRYAHENSLAYKENFLHLPLVNLWIKELGKMIPTHTLPFSTRNFLPTYDIDIAFCYQHHSLIKNVGGFFRDFLKGNIDKVLERAGVYSSIKKDPFNIYDWLDALHQHEQLKPIYFFLVAQQRKGYDKNLQPTTSSMQKLMKQHAEKYTVGLHPSWQSGNDEKLLLAEKATIEKAVGKPINQSRQHYIKMALPKTYRTLVDAGIEHDHSMGYGSINGFRASYTLPFKWFDLQNDQQTNLTIHPFCFMDANAYFEQKLSPQQAALELQQYYNMVKSVNGQLSVVFHNHFLTEQPEWLPWRNLYEAFLKKNFG